MKLYLLLLALLCVHTAAYTQGKDNNKTRQVEQLQQLRQTVSRKIDSLQAQLPELALNIEITRKKIDQLKKETDNQDRPDAESKEQLQKLAVELTNATNLAESLKKKFETRSAALDKALILQKDLEGKISALAKEAN